jgi:very-short-patch-repair endonuclease
MRFRSRPGLRVHRSTIRSDEVTLVDGIPVSTVPRTLFDLAAIASRRQVEKAFNEVEVHGLTDPLSVPALLERYPGRRGSVTLKAILAEAAQTRGVTRRELEERFVAILASTDLPAPQRNVHLAVGDRFFEVDCLWRKQRLVVELDGRATHGTGRAFEGDREKDRLLLVQGWHMVRVTWRQLRDDAPAVVADLRRLLRG